MIAVEEGARQKVVSAFAWPVADCTRASVRFLTFLCQSPRPFLLGCALSSIALCRQGLPLLAAGAPGALSQRLPHLVCRTASRRPERDGPLRVRQMDRSLVRRGAHAAKPVRPKSLPVGWQCTRARRGRPIRRRRRDTRRSPPERADGQVHARRASARQPLAARGHRRFSALAIVANAGTGRGASGVIWGCCHKPFRCRRVAGSTDRAGSKSASHRNGRSPASP